MRHNADPDGHAFESLFHVGVPLAFFALTLAAIGGRRARVAAASVAGIAFAGGPLTARATDDGEHIREVEALTADVDAVRELAAG